jgi:hypothetical protein
LLKFIKSVKEAKAIFKINKSKTRIEPDRLRELLEYFILENMPEFIQFILLHKEEVNDYKTIELKEFLTKEMLYKLYNYQIVRFFNLI